MTTRSRENTTGITEDRGESPDPVITDLRPLPSDPNIRSIRVGGRAVGRLPDAEVQTLGLRPGMVWTPSIAQAVREAMALSIARRDALRLLGQRSFATAAMEQRLIRKGHTLEVAARVSAELASHGWLNDEATARDLAQRTMAHRPAGRKRLEQKLRQRQFDPELAARIAQEVGQQTDPSAQARDLARLRLRRMANAPKEVAARRIASLLDRRGFDADLVSDVLRELRLDDE